MAGLTEFCCCGCGQVITRRDPSPDFKYIQCHLLWLASIDKPDPPWWRASQRYLYRLVALEYDWSHCYWEWEVTDRHIIMYDPDGGQSYERGLAALTRRYVDHFRRPIELPPAPAESYAAEAVAPV